MYALDVCRHGDNDILMMPLGPDYEPEFDSLRDLLLEIAPERSVEHLLRKVVQRLAATASCGAGAPLVAR